MYGSKLKRRLNLYYSLIVKIISHCSPGFKLTYNMESILKGLFFKASSWGCFPLWDQQTSSSNNIVRKKANTGRVSWMSKNLTNPLNRFFQLHEAVIWYSICPVCVPSILVHPHWRDGSHLHIFFINLFPAAVYKTGFLINSASWVSNCHLPVMKTNVACLIWMGDRYSSATCTYRLRPTVKNNPECAFTMQIC